jgi:hypothetical protein
MAAVTKNRNFFNCPFLNQSKIIKRKEMRCQQNAKKNNKKQHYLQVS